MWVTMLVTLLSAGAATTLTPAPILSQCVQACECYIESRKNVANLVVECRDTDDMPPIFPQNTTRLRVDHARVPTLHTQLRNSSLSRLRDLEIVFSGVREVDVEAFSNLRRLRNLDLSNNNLVQLTAKHFANQRHLELVDVTGNTAFSCDEFHSEMAVMRPDACVKCDGHEERCERTTRASVTSTMPKIGDVDGPNNTDYNPNAVPPSMESPMVQPQDLLAVAVAGVAGGIVGACLVAVVWVIWSKIVEPRLYDRLGSNKT